jgi:hypothetical protein
MKKNDYGERFMKKLGVLGAVCACVLPFVFCNTSQAATVQYNYTGMPFVTNVTPFTLNKITATFELSAALGVIPDTPDIVPNAWSISDGLTTITDGATDFDLTLKVGTNASGDITRWNFLVVRNNTSQLNELYSMRTTFSANAGTEDDTTYCTVSPSPSCTFAVARVSNMEGEWKTNTVPLPAAVWLFGSGLLGLLGITRRRRSS